MLTIPGHVEACVLDNRYFVPVSLAPGRFGAKQAVTLIYRVIIVSDGAIVIIQNCIIMSLKIYFPY